MITGASSGIGAALAKELASRGARLFLIARRLKRLQALQAELEDEAAVYVASCDVAEKAEVQGAAAVLDNRLGGADVLVLNAGVGGRTNAAGLDSAEVKRIFDINLMGAVYWLEAVLPMLLEQQEGSVVGISSLAGIRGLPGSAAYAASKAAMSVFLESMRLDLKPRGVRVLTVEPGFVDTELTAQTPQAMPFLMEAAEAAVRIAEAVVKGRSMLRFPLPTSLGVGFLGMLPVPVYDALIGHFEPLVRGETGTTEE